MAYILNDVMLKKLTCSTCGKYLSVLPIKVYTNNVIKCGRCSAENDGGVESIYNRIAENYVFKCVNRYERCNKLLTVSEVVEHEKQCIGGTYRCPKWDHKFCGSAHQLVLHYSRQHPRSIIKNNSFSIKVKRNFREQYLLLVKDNIFFVLVNNLANENILYLIAVSLISCRNVKHWFSVRPLHKQKVITTAVKPCYLLHHFKCDYMHVKTNSMTKVSCRVHLDLSEHVNVVAQISLHRNAELSEPKINPVSKPDEDTEAQRQEIFSVSTYSQKSPKDVLEVRGVLTEKLRNKYPGDELTARSEYVNVVGQIPLQRSAELSERKINLMSKTDEDTEPQRQEIFSASTYSQKSPKDVLEVRRALTEKLRKQYPGDKLTACSEYVNVGQIPLQRSAELSEWKINLMSKTDEDTVPQGQEILSASTYSQKSPKNVLEVRRGLTEKLRKQYPGDELTARSEYVNVGQISLQRSAELSEPRINLMSKTDGDTVPQRQEILSALTYSQKSPKDVLEVRRALTEKLRKQYPGNELPPRLEHVNVVGQIPLQRSAELSEPRINLVSKTDGDTVPQSQRIPSSSADPQKSPPKNILGVIPRVILTDEIRKNYPGYELTPCGTALFNGDKRIELACSNCEQFTGCNVFNCQLSRHILCWYCKAWCGICKTSINGWNVTLANINELLMLPCRWQCGRHFFGNDMAQHELSCEKSGFTCGLCDSASLNLEQLCSHLASAHMNYKNAIRFNLAGYLRERGTQTRGEVYFFHNGYWFTMCWNRKGTIYEVLMFGDHTELYELAVICNTNQRYNKIDNGIIKFNLSDNPRFYMKRLRNM